MEGMSKKQLKEQRIREYEQAVTGDIRVETDSFAEQQADIQTQSERTALAYTFMAPETTVAVPSAVELSEKKLGHFEQKKQDKRIKQERRQATELQREMDAYLAESRSLGEAQHIAAEADAEFINVRMPRLMSFDWSAQCLLPPRMLENADALRALLSDLAAARSCIGRADLAPAIRRQIAPEQLRRLQAMILLREPLEAMYQAQFRCQSGQVPATEHNRVLGEAYAPYREALQNVLGENARAAAQAIRQLESTELAPVLKDKREKQTRFVAGDGTYGEYADRPYMEAHIVQLARCKALAAGEGPGDPNRDVSDSIYAEAKRLAAACGQLDCRRAALAEALRKLRYEKGEDNPDVAAAQAALLEYERRINIMSQRINSAENALSSIMKDEAISMSGLELLQRHGYDTTDLRRSAESRRAAADSAAAYATLHNAKTAMRDRLLDEVNWADFPHITRQSFAMTVLCSRCIMLMNERSEQESRRTLDLVLRVANCNAEKITVNGKEEARGSLKLTPEMYEQLIEFATPYIEYVLSFDIRKLSRRENEGDDEFITRLISYQDEVLAVSMCNMMLSDLISSTMRGRETTVKRYLLGGDPQLLEDFQRISTKLNCAYSVIRGYAMEKAVDMGVFDHDKAWTGTERRKKGMYTDKTLPGNSAAVMKEGIRSVTMINDGWDTGPLHYFNTVQPPTLANPLATFRRTRPQNSLPLR